MRVQDALATETHPFVMVTTKSPRHGHGLSARPVPAGEPLSKTEPGYGVLGASF